MNTLLLTLTCLLGCSAALAQLPDHTQVFEPVPALVTGVTHAAAPSDAIVLFDGNNMNAWEQLEDSASPQWDIEDGFVTVNGTGTLRSKQSFGSFQLHIEWRATDVIQGESQLRGNSGIFLHSLYEIQILDSWENPTYVNGQAGSVYLQHSPLVNAAKRPGEWQSYDIIFTAPVYQANGTLQSPAYVTVLHNRVLVQTMYRYSARPLRVRRSIKAAARPSLTDKSRLVMARCHCYCRIMAKSFLSRISG